MISTCLISIVSLFSTPCCNSKAEGNVFILANYDFFLMFRVILHLTTNIRLDDMTSVKELHYLDWANPYGNLQVTEDQKFQVKIARALLA